MNASEPKFVRFEDWRSTSSEQENSVNNGYNRRKGMPSVGAVLKSIGRKLENGSEKFKNLRKPSTVHPVSDRPKENLASIRSKILDPQGPLLQKWNKIFVITCVMAISVDPLFFYIPVIKDREKCLKIDGTLRITTSVLRTFFDLFYILRIIFQFRTGFIAPSTRVFGRGEVNDNPVAIVKRYLSSYFIIDLLSVIPFPQVLVLAVIPKMKSSPFLAKDLLKYVILVQYVPRLLRIWPLFREVTRTSGILTETAWAGAVFNLGLYMLASHIVGANWYLLSVESEVRCWRKVMENNTQHHFKKSDLGCGPDRAFVISLLTKNTSCPFIDPDQNPDPNAFDFGIFNDALQSSVVHSETDFLKKFFYCFWWGLRNLSSVGQNLKTSTYVVEILFAIFIAIAGLVLFALLIGNMQKYLQSTTVRVEEMRVKRRDAERWMSHRMLPERLRDRVRRYEQYKWQENRGVEEEALIRTLPKDLRRDIRRHLCLALVKKVGIVHNYYASLTN
ncbi:hypothetical protein PIB30_079267 [Stylosanthes scabra]|uniref:Ion transport domain-containing protein n=1 Tax=Stylosanthes scabra TaxID=79078 RepID=A0ABU6RRL8_9FABA|nr:hypothetical protein [Stylosanthes scabra]